MEYSEIMLLSSKDLYYFFSEDLFLGAEMKMMMSSLCQRIIDRNTLEIQEVSVTH